MNGRREREKDPNEIGALWERTSQNGREYMSGFIEGIGNVVCFRADKRSDKQPDWRVLRSRDRDDTTPRRRPDDRPSRVDNIEDAGVEFE